MQHVFSTIQRAITYGTKKERPAISRFQPTAGLLSFPYIPNEVVDDFDFLLLNTIDRLRLPDLNPFNQGGNDLRRQLLHFRELPDSCSRAKAQSARS